ncbi:MAG TPA: ECF-type sigma factor [Isosphaeraceae bacterium]|nr:ECF-type sigma factor [Isosphaeraceae bacterium]
MRMNDAGSVTAWIGDLKVGGEAAAQKLWERYFDRLVNLARSKLRSTRRAGAAEDEEDAALDAFDSFCRGAAAGRFPRLTDRDDLWRLLVVLTIRKALDQHARRNAAKRGGGKVVGESALKGSTGRADAWGLDLLAGSEPPPELAVMVAEQYRLLRDALGDDSLRQVLDLRLEGFSRHEIAARLGCAEKTVSRRMEIIRRAWLGEGD